MRGRGGQQLGSGPVAERGLAHRGGRASPTVCGPTIGCYRSVWAGWRWVSSPKHCRLCSVYRDPGGPHESRGLGQAGQLSEANTHLPRGPGPGSRAGRAIGSRQAGRPGDWAPVGRLYQSGVVHQQLPLWQVLLGLTRRSLRSRAFDRR